MSRSHTIAKSSAIGSDWVFADCLGDGGGGCEAACGDGGAAGNSSVIGVQAFTVGAGAGTNLEAGEVVHFAVAVSR